MSKTRSRGWDATPSAAFLEEEQKLALPVVVTCEHGGNSVPRAYRHLFADADEMLESHRGWDPGALEIARELARKLDAPCVVSTTTRLLVDLNRTRDETGRFSEFTRRLPRDERRLILEEHYTPHWDEVEGELRAAQEQSDAGRVLHLASHSFTPRLHGRKRDFEVGLLFDPRREAEAQLARAWRDALLEREPQLRVRLNLPYRGWTDGMTTAFRRRLGTRYLGIELECNQATLANSDIARELRRALSASLREAMGRIDG